MSERSGARRVGNGATVGMGGENVMGAISKDRRAWLVGWVLRGAGAAVGLLIVALLTATVASAQTADVAVTLTATPNSVTAGTFISVAITVTNNGPSAASDV